MERVYNFSAGPAMLPEKVLQKMSTEMLSYEGLGLSVMEMSHRSGAFKDIIESAEEELRNLLSIPSNYKVLFVQGGASLQFSMIPMNLMKKKIADYIITGMWAKKAFNEAKRFGKVYAIASSEDKNFSCIPDCSDLPVHDEADYVYICENNTIYGTKFKKLPNTKGKILVSDMSSCLLSDPVDVSKYGVIFACAQKNLGIAGTVIVIIREDLVDEDVSDQVPTMLRYDTYVKSKSLYNTPPTYGIYVCKNVFEWIKNVGGLQAMKKINECKARVLYDFLDNSELFHAPVEKDSRSMMNVVFTTNNPEVDEDFVRKAEAQGLVNLRGHRSIGGMRASIYNAMPINGVEVLVDFMKRFEQEHI